MRSRLYCNLWTAPCLMGYHTRVIKVRNIQLKVKDYAEKASQFEKKIYLFSFINSFLSNSPCGKQSICFDFKQQTSTLSHVPWITEFNCFVHLRNFIRPNWRRSNVVQQHNTVSCHKKVMLQNWQFKPCVITRYGKIVFFVKKETENYCFE